MYRKIAVVLLAVLFAFSAVAYSQSSYLSFYRQFVTAKAEEIQLDSNQLDSMLDSWERGEIPQSQVVSKMKEMEVRAEGYFNQILKLSAPEGYFQKHKQTVYVFATWWTIIGIFTEGMADLDLAKIDAAEILSDYFGRKVDSFSTEVLQNQ